MDYLWVALGGGIGAAARYGVTRTVGARAGDALPFGTLVVNLSGSFAIGLLVTLLAMHRADPAWRLLLVVGVLGGYTTYSAFAFETVALLRGGHVGRAVLYAVGTNAGSVAACGIGVALAWGLTR